MYWDVVEAKVLGYLEFAVTFADGLNGKVKILPTHLNMKGAHCGALFCS